MKTLQIDAIIANINVRPQAYCVDLPAIPAADLGCVKHDADFNARAADLIAGSDAGQLEELVRSIGTLCHNVWENTQDPAYSNAAGLLHQAADALRKRLGE